MVYWLHWPFEQIIVLLAMYSFSIRLESLYVAGARWGEALRRLSTQAVGANTV